MLYSYFTIALRHFKKSQLTVFINVTGLLIGIMACLLTAHYVKQEQSYDDFHEQADQIYRITWHDENPQTRTPYPMAQAMVSAFPEVKEAVSLTPIWGSGLTRQTFSIVNPETNTRFDEKEILAVDSTFFQVFDFGLIQGDAEKALREPGAIILTEETAQRYFGEQNPIGKRLVFNEAADLEVMAVVENVPDAAHFHFDFLISYLTLKGDDPEREFFQWADFGHYNYLLLHEDTDALALEAKIPEWIIRNNFIQGTTDKMKAFTESIIGFRLQPITDIHLHSKLRWELESNGNIAYVYLMSVAALIILVIACVNFINLTTARSVERAKEIGMRKAMGALRKHLSLQFIAESLLVTLISFFLCILLVQWLLPFFNQVIGANLNLDDLLSPQSLAITFLCVCALGIVSSLYPALYLSSFRPGQILKGRFKTSEHGLWLRKSLIVFQFSIAIALMLGSMMIFKQLDYISNKSLGYNQEQLMVVPVKSDKIRDQLESVKNELQNIPGLTEVAACSNIPGRAFNNNALWSEEDALLRINASESFVDYDYFSALQIRMKEGRAFSRVYSTDSLQQLIVNQAAVTSLNLEQPLGKVIHWDSEFGEIEGSIIGVTEDFHFQSLHLPIQPMIFQLRPSEFNYLLIRLEAGFDADLVAAIERKWIGFDERFAFEYFFLDERLQQQYKAEQQMTQLFSLFSGLSILIAAFGLYGLSAYTSAQRTKEVGIRKVLGASFQDILLLLNRDLLQLIGISILIALPLGSWAVNRWLNNFAYRISFSWETLIVAAALGLLTALVTVSYHAFYLASRKPVESLRSE